jgi:hypothetical protein
MSGAMVGRSFKASGEVFTHGVQDAHAQCGVIV